jgi:ribosomal protein L31E
MSEKRPHTSDCDWHADQCFWECTCGAIPLDADELTEAVALMMATHAYSTPEYAKANWKSYIDEAREAVEIVRKALTKEIEVELSMCAIANDEASSEWFDGFNFAWTRVRLAMEDTQ